MLFTLPLAVLLKGLHRRDHVIQPAHPRRPALAQRREPALHDALQLRPDLVGRLPVQGDHLQLVRARRQPELVRVEVHGGVGGVVDVAGLRLRGVVVEQGRGGRVELLQAAREGLLRGALAG